MNIEMQNIKKKAADLQPLNDFPAGSVDPRYTRSCFKPG